MVSEGCQLDAEYANFSNCFGDQCRFCFIGFGFRFIFGRFALNNSKLQFRSDAPKTDNFGAPVTLLPTIKRLFT